MKKKWFSSYGYALSLAFHALLLFVFASVQLMPASYVTEDGVEVEWVQLEDDKGPFEQRQIVEQDETPINNETPLQDYKLSKNDQRVLHETKAKNQGAFQNTDDEAARDKTKKQDTAQKTKPEKKLSFSDLMPDMVTGPLSPTPPQDKGNRTGSQASATDDYLKDTKVGKKTLLNTREFVYYSYYNRIKHKLRQYWEPKIKQKIVDLLQRGRRIAATSDKITRLVITLDSAGQLKKVQVRGASGYRELDDAAIEAFQAAAPFPNPPQGIGDARGEIRINWDFVLEI